MIGRETIDRVRARTSLVSLVAETVKLTRRGRSFVGLCPFHQEKSGSFTVSDERGLFHCFGCKMSGDVFKFVELTEGVGFMDALKKLAEAGGIGGGEADYYSADDVVSSAWSCLLADGLGARAQTRIRASEADGTTGHTPMPGFFDAAWAFFAGRTNAQ